VRIGRVADGQLTPARARSVDAWAAEEHVACLYFLADSGDASSAHVAESAGFRLMDLRVELGQELGDRRDAGAVRAAQPADRERLRQIARRSHGTTRFYADPNFPDERCDALYETWIERSLDGWAAAVLVADLDRAPAGYCTCHLDRGAGSIGLIAVDEAAQRSGLGFELANGAVEWCAARGARTMSVVTQGRNGAALRTFERVGFRVASVGLWFHKWYDA
jgi:dTDP-4-amino-4,6-dideoxy-D-galactose acyltransferase